MTPPLIISSSVIVVNEVSASFFFGTASNAITASFISDFDPIITSVPSSSWASSSLSSSYSLKSLTADTASSVPIFLPTNSNQLLLMGHINSDATIYQLNSAIKADNHGALSASAFYGTSSWSSNAINANSASFVLNAVSASYVPDIDIAVTSVASASWSSASLSSSYSKNADTASFVLNAVSASFSPNQGATTLFTGSTYPITSSWSSNSVTASFITLSQTASYVTTAQTASFNLNSVSSSYSKNADTSSFANTASYSVTSSYATVGVDTTRVAKAGDGMSGSLTLSASNIVFSPTTATVGGLSWPNQNNWKVLPATSNALVWTSGGSGIITFDNSGLQLIAAGTYLGFATTTNANPDVALYREAAGVLSLRTVSGSSFTAPIPQSIRIYNFYSASGAQFERTSNYWSGSNYYIATEYSGS